jgi:ElaB/YqjD/DUF883 family membrane-anchored ribosome-binding protein
MANYVQPGQQGGAPANARESAEQLRERAVERVETMKEKAASGKERLSERVRRVGSAIHSAGDQIRGEDETWARYVDRVSDRFERAAEYVRRTDPQQAMRDAERFARREPALFFGGAFVLGLAAGRLFKASGRYEQREEQRPYRGETPAYPEGNQPGETWSGSTLEGERE